MLIPIGSWCRTAYQVKKFLFDKNVRAQSYPYDWSITPFSALIRTLDVGFNLENVLNPDNLRISGFGSILDEETFIIHHHEFLPEKISDMSKKGGVNSKHVPLALFDNVLISNAQSRFKYTYQNLIKLRACKKKIGFVRWCRFGHPDQELPEAFSGENLKSLSNIIGQFLGHDNFSILQVISEINNGEINDDDIIKEYSASEIGVLATISERRGFDGDGTNNFRGDTKSWDLILSRFVSDYRIPISYSFKNKLLNTCTKAVISAARSSRQFFVGDGVKL